MNRVSSMLFYFSLLRVFPQFYWYSICENIFFEQQFIIHMPSLLWMFAFTFRIWDKEQILLTTNLVYEQCEKINSFFASTSAKKQICNFILVNSKIQMDILTYISIESNETQKLCEPYSVICSLLILSLNLSVSPILPSF